MNIAIKLKYWSRPRIAFSASAWYGFLLSALWLIFSNTAAAGGIGEFSGPLNKVMETLSGPIGRAVCVLGLIACGYTLITQKEDLSGGAKAMLSWALFSCFIALALPIADTLFSFSGAVI